MLTARYKNDYVSPDETRIIVTTTNYCKGIRGLPFVNQIKLIKGISFLFDHRIAKYNSAAASDSSFKSNRISREEFETITAKNLSFAPANEKPLSCNGNWKV